MKPKEIKRKRHSKGMTQQQLAVKAGCHSGHISRIERGMVKNVHPLLMKSIVKALK